MVELFLIFCSSLLAQPTLEFHVRSPSELSPSPLHVKELTSAHSFLLSYTSTPLRFPSCTIQLGKGFFTQPKMSYASPQQVVLKYRRGRIVSKKSRSGFDYPELDRSSSGPSSRGGDGGRGRRKMGQDRGGSGGLGAGGRGAEGGGEKRYPSPSSSSLGGGRGSRGDRGETKNPYDDI